jgi:tRNA-binding protein
MQLVYIAMKTEESTLTSLEEITFSDFLKVDIRVGQIIEVTDNLKAKQSAYVLTIDFGELGQKTSSAQITQNYTKEELLGKQIIAVVNFPAKRVAGVKSEVLVLAAVCKTHGTILLEPNTVVENGTRIS